MKPNAWTRASILAILAATPSAWAQATMDLATAHRLAKEADPRLVQLKLEADRTELRVLNIEAERRPSFVVQGQAQHQSEVVALPVPGAGVAPPKDSVDASASVEQSLLDPSRGARLAAERARLTEAQAQVNVVLYGLRREVDEAYFAAALLQERETQVTATIGDLEARLCEARARVEAGAALPSEAASIEATLLQRQEDVSALRANRAAALERLRKLTNHAVSADDRLPVPALDAPFAAARTRAGAIRQRPEFARLAASRERLEAQRDLSRAERKPQVSAFGKVAYGRPGLDFLSTDLHSYWLAGVRVQWRPVDWGASSRRQQIVDLERQSVQADEDALARALERQVQADLSDADRLREAVADDDRIVALRELIARETQARYDEHVVTAADLLDKESDVLEARVQQATHRIELAQAQARALNTLGVEVE